MINLSQAKPRVSTDPNLILKLATLRYRLPSFGLTTMAETVIYKGTIDVPEAAVNIVDENVLASESSFLKLSIASMTC